MAKKTPYVILGLLSEEPLDGYDIKKRIDIRFRFFWNESYGQIYPELRNMVKLGWITSETIEGKKGKTVYAITDQGRNELKTWLHLPVETESLRLEILLKMYFAALGNPTTMHDHVETFLASHQKDLMILNMFKKELETIDDPYQNHQYILSVIDFGIKTNEAYLNWSQEALHMLQAKENRDETK